MVSSVESLADAADAMEVDSGQKFQALLVPYSSLPSYQAAKAKYEDGKDDQFPELAVRSFGPHFNLNTYINN